MGEHIYLSTACLHGMHGYCQAPTVTRDGGWETVGPSYSTLRDEAKVPAQCKFCPARCVCTCHAGSGRERSPDPIDVGEVTIKDDDDHPDGCNCAQTRRRSWRP